MDLIFLSLLEQPNFLAYDAPLNWVCVISALLGVLLQTLFFMKRRKRFLLPLILLVLCAACEGLYLFVGTFEALLFALIGVPAYFALFASLLVTLFGIIWTKVRHS